jgi:hypothetical protein
MTTDTSFAATGPAGVAYGTFPGSNIDQGANLTGNTLGVLGVCGGTSGPGVAGVGGPNAGAGVSGEGGANGGVGVFAQGGANGGAGVFALGDPNGGMGVVAVGGGNGGVAIQAEANVAHIRMIPSVTVGTGDPNTANIPGQPGDLLAVFKQPIPALDDTVASLWFNAGGATPWKQLFEVSKITP